MDQDIAVSRGKRVLISLAWGLVQSVILACLFFLGGVAGGFLTVYVFSDHEASALALLGFSAGVAAAITVNHSARIWLQRLRLRGLRRTGTAARAEVTHISEVYTRNPRGGPGITTFTVRVRWADPLTGAHWQGERMYRFWGRASKNFRSTCARGARLSVYYPQDHTSRFVIDIPFAPMMADLL